MAVIISTRRRSAPGPSDIISSAAEATWYLEAIQADEDGWGAVEWTKHRHRAARVQPEVAVAAALLIREDWDDDHLAGDWILSVEED